MAAPSEKGNVTKDKDADSKQDSKQARVALMYQQRQSFDLLTKNEKIENKKRKQNAGRILTRISTMQQTADELYSYLKHTIDLQCDYEEKVHRSIQKTFGNDDNYCSVRATGITIDALQKHRYEQFCDIRDGVYQHLLSTALAHKTSVQKQATLIRQEIENLTSECKQSRQQVVSLWSEYQAALDVVLNVKNLQNAPSPKSSKYPDPFVIGKLYDWAQCEYVHSLEEYNKNMTNIFNEVIVTDKENIDGIKSILSDYFLSEKSKTMNQLKLIETAIHKIKGIDKEEDSTKFIKQFASIQQTKIPNAKELRQNGTNSIEMQMSTFQFSDTAIFRKQSKELTAFIFSDVVQKGVMYRPGKIIASNWKPLYATITRFGYFHTFETKEHVDPTASVAVRGSKIKITKNEPEMGLFTFDIVVPNESWFSLTGNPTVHSYKVDDRKQFKCWISILRKFAEST